MLINVSRKRVKRLVTEGSFFVQKIPLSHKMREGMSIREWRGFSILITGGVQVLEDQKDFLMAKTEHWLG